MSKEDFILRIAASLLRGRQRMIVFGGYDEKDQFTYAEALVRARQVADALRPLFEANLG